MWIELANLERIDKWDYRLPSNVYNDLIELRSMLITAGYTISELAELDFSEGFAIPRSKHKAILNILESNINRVYAALDFYYPYYRERVRYTDYYPGLSNLNRWVDFCNHLKAILEGEEGRPYPLYYDSTTPLYYEYGSPLYYPIYINEEV